MGCTSRCSYGFPYPNSGMKNEIESGFISGLIGASNWLILLVVSKEKRIKSPYNPYIIYSLSTY